MLLVQEYLQDHSFGDLEKEHGINISRSKDAKKISLNYDMILAKNSDLIAQECRGLILAKSDLTAFPLIEDKLDQNVIVGPTCIVAFPFRRFFNSSQEEAANINWNDPKLSVQEKKDGTLTILYFCPVSNQWCVATRSVCEANVPLDNGRFTFRQLFEKGLFDTAGMSFEGFTAKLDKDITYLFELTSPYNTIVIQYPETSITWLAARNIKTLQELDITTFDIGIPRTHRHTLANLDETIAWVNSQNGSETEGVVVCDGSFNRIKIKNPSYLIYSKLNSKLGASYRNCLELVLLGREDDAIPILPKEIADDVIKIKRQLQDMINGYESFYSAIVSSLKEQNKKEFALIIQRYDIWSAPMYQMYAGKVKNMKEFIEANKIDGSWSNSFLDRVLEALVKYE